MFWYIFFGFLGLVAVGAVWAFVFMQKVRRDGLDAEAVVARIEVSESLDSDGTRSVTKRCIVRYTNQNGTLVEAALANPKKGLAEGGRVRIKYLPGRENYPVLTEIL